MLRTLALSLFLASPLAAQSANPRHELAWRTRALERAWISTGAEQHAKALPQIEGAVQRFFAMDMAGVAAALDVARFTLGGDERPTDLERFSITPAARLIDQAAPSIELVLGNAYATEFAAPLVLSAQCNGQPLVLAPARVEAPGAGQTRTLVLGLDGVPPGTGELSIEVGIANEGDLRSTRTIRISRAVQRDERMRAVRAAVADLPDDAPALERGTLEGHLALLDSLARGSTEETDFPATRLLTDCETIASAIADGERWFGPGLAGQSWLTVPNGKTGARVRVFVPEGLSAERPAPIVVALHGAGGSENMFFDSYGDGRIVELCRARGWVLVAPRVSFLGAPVKAVLDALSERLPIDRERVLLIGHSMGAGVGQQLVAKDPAMFRAFAALGGGSGLKDASALKQEPIFVGAGERDFGRRGAEALHKSLVDAGSETAQLKIYPACEHLMVVVDALPDVFVWWDALLGAK